MDQKKRKKRRRRRRCLRGLVWLVVIFFIGGTVYYVWKTRLPQKDQEIIVDSYNDMRIPDVMYKWQEKAGELEAIRIAQEEQRRAETTMDFSQYFARDLFIGDSITESLSYYKLLNPENVYAKIGINMSTLKNQVQEIIDRAPETIYILMGTNDLAGSKSTDLFIQEYKEFVDSIRGALPDTELVIQSVIPMTDHGYQSHPNITQERVAQYNYALKEFAQSEELYFLDLSELFTDPTIFEPDGIHLVYSFYGQYLEHIRKWEQNRSDEDEEETLEANHYGRCNYGELASL